jgi:hypothetical protein
LGVLAVLPHVRGIETVPYNPNNASANVYGGNISLTPRLSANPAAETAGLLANPDN